MYFFFGFTIAYGIKLYTNPNLLTSNNGYAMVRFFLVGFVACIPAIISGAVVGKMKFYAQTLATIIIATIIYLIFEGMI